MPVFTTVGPDGALYVVDFYRKVVEHPEWVRKDLVNDNKLFDAGEDKGRIYRVVAEGSHPYTPPRLDQANVSELVRTLAHENMWWRLTAQRLLVERQDKAAVPELDASCRRRFSRRKDACALDLGWPSCIEHRHGACSSVRFQPHGAGTGGAARGKPVDGFACRLQS